MWNNRYMYIQAGGVSHLTFDSVTLKDAYYDHVCLARFLPSAYFGCWNLTQRERQSLLCFQKVAPAFFALTKSLVRDPVHLSHLIILCFTLSFWFVCWERSSSVLTKTTSRVEPPSLTFTIAFHFLSFLLFPYSPPVFPLSPQTSAPVHSSLVSLLLNYRHLTAPRGFFSRLSVLSRDWPLGGRGTDLRL